MTTNGRLFRKAWLLPLIGVSIALMAVALWTATSFKAQAQNAKNTAVARGDLLAVIPPVGTSWTTILEGEIQTSQGEDVVYDVSLECSLWTETLVRSKGGTADTSKAEAMVQVQVMVDHDDDPATALEQANPGIVVFCSRNQTLMAKLSGVNTCTDLNGDGVYQITECTITDEELQLILETTNANAFNFFTRNLKVGPHHIEVQAKVTTNTYFDPDAVAKAAVGKGTVAIDEVKFVR